MQEEPKKLRKVYYKGVLIEEKEGSQSGSEDEDFEKLREEVKKEMIEKQQPVERDWDMDEFDQFMEQDVIKEEEDDDEEDEEEVKRKEEEA